MNEAFKAFVRRKVTEVTTETVITSLSGANRNLNINYATKIEAVAYPSWNLELFSGLSVSQDFVEIHFEHE